MAHVFKSRALSIFFVLAVVIALVAMAIRATDPAALGQALREIFANNERADILVAVRYSIETPVLWNAILFPAAPTIAAFIVILCAWGPRGLARWFSRLAPWRGVSWRQGVAVWLLVFVAFMGLVGVVALYATGRGDLEALPQLLDRYGGEFHLALGVLALSLVLSSGPLLEEMGWRAFALPLLLTRLSPLMASVVLGCLWAAWHLPREIAPLMSGADGAFVSFLFKQINFWPGCIATSIIATFLYFKLGGSVWSGILAHAVNNELVVNVLRIPEPAYMLGDFALRGWGALELLIAITIVILTNGRLGAEGDPRSEPHPFSA